MRAARALVEATAAQSSAMPVTSSNEDALRAELGAAREAAAAAEAVAEGLAAESRGTAEELMTLEDNLISVKLRNKQLIDVYLDPLQYKASGQL